MSDEFWKKQGETSQLVWVWKRSFHPLLLTHTHPCMYVCVCELERRFHLPPTPLENEVTLFCASRLHTKLTSSQIRIGLIMKLKSFWKETPDKQCCVTGEGAEVKKKNSPNIFHNATVWTDFHPHSVMWLIHTHTHRHSLALNMTKRDCLRRTHWHTRESQKKRKKEKRGKTTSSPNSKQMNE